MSLFSVKKVCCFACGMLFGTAGMKILGSADARKCYAHTVAAGLRMKESVMKTATNIQEHAEDIYAEAQHINDCRKADVVVEDASGETPSAEAPEA